MRKFELALNLYFPGLVVVVTALTLLMNSSGRFAAIAASLLFAGFTMVVSAKVSLIRRGFLVTFGAGKLSVGYRKLYIAGYSTMAVGILAACF